VSASDKTTSKLNCITKRDAFQRKKLNAWCRKHKTKDEAAASHITAKNALESYAYNLCWLASSILLTRPSWRLLSMRPFLGWIVLRRH